MTRKKPASIDQYLQTLRGPRRAALEKLRRAIHRIVPDVEECISYGIPAFRYEGKVIAGFVATVKGCSYFPFSGATLATLAKDVARYDRTKSALHFDPAKGLPITLTKKLLRARIAEL